MPPSFGILLRSIDNLFDHGNSDVRGTFLDHATIGSLVSVAHAVKKTEPSQPLLTPFSAYLLGTSFGKYVANLYHNPKIAIGMDPRSHGSRLVDSFARGAESIDTVQVMYSGITTTPACASFCSKCEASVMVTASHLPTDRNGFKFFTRHAPSGLSHVQIQQLGSLAHETALYWLNLGIIPPSSGSDAVMCSQKVDWMPDYARSLKQAIVSKTSSSKKLPLEGLKIVLNAGNGSGGFFYNVLEELGADVTASVGIDPDGTFPVGVPNPEDPQMLKFTTDICQSVQADLGIMLDTDADRCGFVVPRKVGENGQRSEYEALNRNRLIALLAVIFANQSPGCAVVTDSVTSEGLTFFLQETLGLQHVRYLKGYANVIGKARDLTEAGSMNAELAIETSGHCAMRENNYLDDGTYTAVQVVSLLARTKDSVDSLLDLIVDLKEQPEVAELRMKTVDGSLDTMRQVFDECIDMIAQKCQSNDQWTIDEDNLEGIRVRLGNGQFFMLRKSLHDPIISLQIEANSHESARELIVDPILDLLGSLDSKLEMTALTSY